MSPRAPNPAEERTLRALRQANVITGAQFDDALARLEACGVGPFGGSYHSPGSSGDLFPIIGGRRTG